MSLPGPLRRGFGPEEERSRPSGPGDKVLDLRKGGEFLSTIFVAGGMDGDLVGLAPPLADESGPRFEAGFTSEGSGLIGS